MIDASRGIRRGVAPLEGIRVLEYAQYVAGPLAAKLLADLGADVIKVEPPAGDAYRHYDPVGPAESFYFASLNHNKRSVVLDLKSLSGRRLNERLLATADAVIHNFPSERAARFGLDRNSVRAVNPDAVCVSISAFGSAGPDAGLIGYDLIAQAVSGLLVADARPDDEVPRRWGGIPMTDITAGLLCCSAVIAGLFCRQRAEAPGIDISLLGAALLAQVQRVPAALADGDVLVNRETLRQRALDVARREELEPYYRCYATTDGYIAVACLNLAQRKCLLGVLGLQDPWVENPQAPPADEAERAKRATLATLFAGVFGQYSTAHWLASLQANAVPAAEVRHLAQAITSGQVNENELVREVQQPAVGSIAVVGNVFGNAVVQSKFYAHVPALGEHNEEILSSLSRPPTGAAGTATRKQVRLAGTTRGCFRWWSRSLKRQ
jgi:crotonobetainyl-CoA:carnitine CoA-transferase CaiB-like acyl-CoA transferase